MRNREEKKQKKPQLISFQKFWQNLIQSNFVFVVQCAFRKTTRLSFSFAQYDAIDLFCAVFAPAILFSSLSVAKSQCLELLRADTVLCTTHDIWHKHKHKTQDFVSCLSSFYSQNLTVKIPYIQQKKKKTTCNFFHILILFDRSFKLKVCWSRCKPNSWLWRHLLVILWYLT